MWTLHLGASWHVSHHIYSHNFVYLSFNITEPWTVAIVGFSLLKTKEADSYSKYSVRGYRDHFSERSYEDTDQIVWLTSQYFIHLIIMQYSLGTIIQLTQHKPEPVRLCKLSRFSLTGLLAQFLYLFILKMLYNDLSHFLFLVTYISGRHTQRYIIYCCCENVLRTRARAELVNLKLDDYVHTRHWVIFQYFMVLKIYQHIPLILASCPRLRKNFLVP